MKTLLTIAALLLATAPAVQAYDSDIDAIATRYKPGKLIKIGDVAKLMRGSERWCYRYEDHSCAWTDIYLDVTKWGATFEIGNAWSADTDIAFTDQGVFRDNRFICETGFDWVPSIRATRRSDGSVIGGRELGQLKQDIADVWNNETLDCFDYLFVSADPVFETVTLRQRDFIDDTHSEADDVEVVLFFNPEDAAALTLRE